MAKLVEKKKRIEEKRSTGEDGSKTDQSSEGSSSEESSTSSGENHKEKPATPEVIVEPLASDVMSSKKEGEEPRQAAYVQSSHTVQILADHTYANYTHEVAEMYNVEVRPNTKSITDLDIPRGITKGEPRRLIMVRHGERMERVFPAWLRLARAGDRYVAYNLGQPVSIPNRSGGIEAFHNDPPITRIGTFTSELIGREIASMKFTITGVYSSPALRCIETSHEFLKVLDSSCGETKIEYGLFEWLGWYEKIPRWMSVNELKENNFCIDATYKPVYNCEALQKNIDENTYDFYKRSAEVICKILSNSCGTTLIVTHGPTIDAAIRFLLKLDKSAPRWEELEAIGTKYPYCSTVVLEQDSSGERWKLATPLKSATFLNRSTKPDYRFVQRKCVH